MINAHGGKLVNRHVEKKATGLFSISIQMILQMMLKTLQMEFLVH